MVAPALLERLGLHRRELRAWAYYDVANSAFMTTVLAVFPLYFVRVPAAGLPEAVARSRYDFATAFAVGLVGLLGPFLGAVADHRASKKRFLGGFLALGAAATAALGLASRGEWLFALLAFVIANIGITSTLAFYNALLPGIASRDEIDRVSTGGFALGYLGGGALFALNLWMIASPGRFGLADAAAASRASFLSVAVWWVVFSIPLFRRVPEPGTAVGPAGESALRVARRRLVSTIRELRRFPDAGLMLLAFFVYNEAINTIIRMATLYGDEIRIPTTQLMLALLMVQLVGMPFSFAFGAMADRIGARRAISVALAAYVGISVYAYFIHTVLQFFVLAFLVATVMGGAQALSRSLFATLVPRHKAGEMFGFFAVCDRLGNGGIGSLLFGLMLLLTGSSRPAILALVVFFAVGALLLSRVDVERGRRLARQAEATAA